ncbi:hypothetical protein [Gottfriedia solisilvae]|uniref:hypothetical protein n=1 Tax=Gottfriedia solisilvae TaxID=1516104 RepID=UPI001669514A|nr:hypothetical protein [Gottfriedia solisilvae]
MRFALLFILIGCSKEQVKNDADWNEQTTIPQYWVGPTDTGVSSRDLGQCGKSKIAQKMNLPGFIGINFTGEHLSYRSSEKVVQFSQELMVDSGYTLEKLSLLIKKDSVDEVYVGLLNNKNKITRLVVYKKGACS